MRPIVVTTVALFCAGIVLSEFTATRLYGVVALSLFCAATFYVIGRLHERHLAGPYHRDHRARNERFDDADTDDDGTGVHKATVG